MDLVPTDAEVAEAERIYKIAYDADFGRGYGMRRALESFLQGRAKPAQEEITDAERYQFAAKHCVLSGGGRFGWSIAPCTKAEWDRYLDAAIRASKGEKT